MRCTAAESQQSKHVFLLSSNLVSARTDSQYQCTAAYRLGSSKESISPWPSAVHVRPSPDEITTRFGVDKAHVYINAEDKDSKDPKKRKPKKLPDIDKAQIVAKRVCIALIKTELEECGAIVEPLKHLMNHIKVLG